MRCKWNKKELIKLRNEIAKTGKHPISVDILNDMLDTYNNTMNLENYFITPVRDKFEIKKASKNFKSGLERYPDWFQDCLIDIFKIESDYDYITGKPKATKMHLKNREIIEWTHDCLLQFNDPKMMKYFNNLVKDTNHFLHFAHVDVESENTVLYGLTYSLYNNRSYILLNRNDTLMDFVSFVHEFMHAYFDKMKIYSSIDDYFCELEGRFGNLVGFNYIHKLGYEEEAKLLFEKDLRNILDDSFDLYLNDLLCATATEEDIDIEKAKEIYEQELPWKWYFDKIQSQKIFSVYGGKVMGDIFSYMTILDLKCKGYSYNEILEKVKYLKTYDDERIFNKLKKNDITFPFDDYKNLRQTINAVKNRT